MSQRNSQLLVWIFVALFTLGLHAAALMLIRFPGQPAPGEQVPPTRLDFSILTPVTPAPVVVPEAPPTPIVQPEPKTEPPPKPFVEPPAPEAVKAPIPPKPDPTVFKKQQEKLTAEKRALAKKNLEEKRRKEQMARAARAEKAKRDATAKAKAASARKRAAEAKRIASKPSAISQRLPKYPRSAERKGIKGNTTLRITIGSNGRVTSSSIAKSSGHTILDKAALSAVKSWLFKPAKNGLGQAVSYTTTQLIRFQ